MRAFRLFLLSAFCLLPSAYCLLHAQSPPRADELARALQKKYDGIRDFAADFVHIYEGGVLRKKTTERGNVLVKKPGKMRWTYTEPERKLFVSDGHNIYSYIPADKQVIVSSMPTQDHAGAPILFLLGKGNLVRDFVVSYAEPAAGAKPVPTSGRTYTLKLVPKKQKQGSGSGGSESRPYEWLMLVVDRKTLQIRMLMAADNQGGRSTFSFTSLKENVGLSDKPFTFKIPRGTDVITGGDLPS